MCDRGVLSCRMRAFCYSSYSTVRREQNECVLFPRGETYTRNTIIITIFLSVSEVFYRSQGGEGLKIK